jgi:NAD(P)-dependent dehydrogenase (short-subunit alcohol dehydrogenase family)
MALLEGDNALVTGAASGIGRGIARALAGEGARLVLTDIAEMQGAALARELNATFISADLADSSAPRRLFEAATKALGSISIFVHSASPKRHEGETVLALTEAEWDAMTTVGLRAGFVLGQAAGARWRVHSVGTAFG